MKFNNRNVHISPTAIIGKNVKIGDNTVIYDNVEIGDDSIICNDCVIGEPLNAYYFNESYENPKTIIGKSSLVRSHTILYAGSTFGDFFNTGHRAVIREHTVMGHHCLVGTQSSISGNVTIGNYCRLHNNVSIAQNSKLGNFIFMYPYVSFTNDPHPPSNTLIGPTVDDFTQIAAHSVLLPGVKIGKMCLISANSTVGIDVPDQSMVFGVPGKVIGKVKWIKSVEKPGQSHYPWVYNFERGMPWEGIGYDHWQSENPEFPSYKK